MDLVFRDKTLERLACELAFRGSYDRALVRAYRKRIQLIQAAPDERAFRDLKSLHFERLKGKRRHQYSMRLNDQFRLILELEKASTTRRVAVVRIEDYH